MLLTVVLAITIVWISSTDGSTLSPNAYRSYTPPLVNLTSCVNEVAVFTIQNMRSGGLIYLRTTTGVRKVESSFDTNGDIYTYQCSFDDCGIKWFVKFAFVSQRHTEIQTSYDLHLTFLCLADLVNIMPGGGATKDTDTGETLKHYYFRAEASMTFYDPEGMKHETGGFVKLGTPMDIYINLTNNIEDMFDVTVKSCSVILLPIIEERCVVDEELFGAFTRVAVGLWYNNFSMFRPTSTAAGPIDVLFACTLEVCRNPCPSYFCNGTEAVLVQNNTTRRKRQAAPPTSSRSLRLGTVFRVAYEEPILIEPEDECMDTSTLVTIFTSCGVLLIGSTTSLLYYITEWNRTCQVDNASNEKVDKPNDKIASDLNMTQQDTDPVKSTDILTHKHVQAVSQLVIGKNAIHTQHIDKTGTFVAIPKTIDKLDNTLTIKQTKTLQTQREISPAIDYADIHGFDVQKLQQSEILNTCKIPQSPETSITVNFSDGPTVSQEHHSFTNVRVGFASGLENCDHPQNTRKPQTESPTQPAGQTGYSMESQKNDEKPLVNSPNQSAIQAGYANESKQSTNKTQVNSPNQLARQASYAMEPKHCTNKPMVYSPNQHARQVSLAAMVPKQNTYKPQVNSPNQLARQASYTMEPKQSTNTPMIYSPNHHARQAISATVPLQNTNKPQGNTSNQSDRHAEYSTESKQSTNETSDNSLTQPARQHNYVMETKQNINKPFDGEACHAMDIKFPNNEALHRDETTRKRSASEAIAREIITMHSRSSSLKHRTHDYIGHAPKHRYSQRSARSSELTTSPQLHNTVKPCFGKQSAVGNIYSHETKRRAYSESEVCDSLKKEHTRRITNDRSSSLKVNNNNSNGKPTRSILKKVTEM